MNDTTRFKDGISLLVQLGWEKTGQGDLGQTWAKGDMRAQIAYDARGAEWRRFATGLADAEGISMDALEAQLVKLDTVRRPARSSRAEMDIHLVGPTIRKSEGNAQAFGKFVSRFATTVKEIIKSDLGLARLDDRLVVQGVQPGSLRARFLEPALLDEGALVDIPAGASPEADALWRLGQVFNIADKAAESPSDSEDLAAATSMSVAARASLNALSGLLQSSHWSATGYLRGNQAEKPEPVRLSLAGAHRLAEITKDERYSTGQRHLIGNVDGWQWSDGMMRFVTETGSIRAAVPVGLSHRVAELIREPDVETTATFSATKRQTPDGRVVTTNYVLVAIDPVDRIDERASLSDP